MARILVIDDQEPIRSLLRAVLEGEGHQVLEASNGRLGLELYRERSVDLVITDIVMPEMDGLEMILELTRNFLNVKVIAMSGSLESEGKLQRGEAVGCAADVSQALRYGTITQGRSIRFGALAGTDDCSSTRTPVVGCLAERTMKRDLLHQRRRNKALPLPLSLPITTTRSRRQRWRRGRDFFSPGLKPLFRGTLSGLSPRLF